MKSPTRTIAIIALVVALIAGLIFMNKMVSNDDVSGVKPAVGHDHDGDGKPDPDDHH